MPKSIARLATASTLPLLLILALTAIPKPLAATSFNLTFDPSTSAAPSQFFSAFLDAAQFYENTFTDPITINLHVGWGEINGNNLNPGLLGQSSTFQQGFYSYGQVKTALQNDATTAADAMALAHLPVTDPTNGAHFVMSNAEAKALGLLAGSAPGLDGYVGFNSAAAYTFDPNNRAVAGKYDFIGLASHEITEIMGRYGLGQNGAASGRYSPLDLFRYSAPGALDLIPANGAYFSIDGGNTVINVFHGTSGGDLSDWAGLTPDSYNEVLTLGRELDVTPGDITEMDVIGYNAAVAPEPATVTLLAFGVAALSLRWKRRIADRA